MKREFLIIIASFFVLAILGGFSLVSYPEVYFNREPKKTLFEIQSIDTMKYSRDAAREKLRDQSFDKVIDREMELIVAAGATHVAIGTPYDEEFIPILKRWIASARAHGLSIWFRGNFSGWEGWFGYSKIGRSEHRRLLNDFFRTRMNLFRDGDIFTPCPECENGGPGDPRQTGDTEGFRKFLVDEYSDALDALRSAGKSVKVYNSMNGDIARYIMDQKTAGALGGVILVDHYVGSASRFGKDIAEIRNKLKADVGLGETGAPIPDINGNMTESAQAKFVRALLEELYLQNSNIPAVNYWTLEGGSAELVSQGKPREAYSVVKEYFRMPSLSGVISNTEGKILSGSEIGFEDGSYSIESANGFYQIFVPPSERVIIVKKEGYQNAVINLDENFATSTEMNIKLEPIEKTLWDKIRAFFEANR